MGDRILLLPRMNFEIYAHRNSAELSVRPRWERGRYLQRLARVRARRAQSLLVCYGVVSQSRIVTIRRLGLPVFFSYGRLRSCLKWLNLRVFCWREETRDIVFQKLLISSTEFISNTSLPRVVTSPAQRGPSLITNEKLNHDAST
jgi:hypothetical protein